MEQNSATTGTMHSEQSRRILFLAEGQLGDLLLLTPALRAVKESLPQATVAVLVVERRSNRGEGRFDDLSASDADRARNPLAGNPNVDELYVVHRDDLRAQHGMARLRAERAVIKFMRERKFDTVVCTFPEDRFVQWAFAAGARIRVGQRKQPLRWLLTHTVDAEKSHRGVLEYYCDLVRALGVTVRSTATEYAVPASELDAARAFLRAHAGSRPIVAVHPGASGQYKIWPPERYAQLLDRISQRYGVLLLGGDADREVLDAIRRAAHAPFLDVNTHGSIGKLAAFLRQARLCISNDSGPRHLAIAVGTPSLALFRQHHDRAWDVYDQGPNIAICKSRRQCPACPAGVCRDLIPPGERFGSYCMRQIDVDEVAERAEQMIASF